jgi:hypothetical protein
VRAARRGGRPAVDALSGFCRRGGNGAARPVDCAGAPAGSPAAGGGIKAAAGRGFRAASSAR